MTDLIEVERQQRETRKRNIRRHHNRLMDALQAEIEQKKRNENKFLLGIDTEEGSEKRRRVKRGESKMKSFSMGGMADYIKDLL